MKTERHQQIDLIDHATRSASALSYQAPAFHAAEPWSRLLIEKVALRAGVWTVEAEGELPQGAEIRMRSADLPLLVLPLDGRSGFATLPASTYDIELVLSPWPGRFEAGNLRLRHLSTAGKARRLGESALRLLRNPKRFEVLARVLGALRRGGPIVLGAARSSETPAGMREGAAKWTSDTITPLLQEGFSLLDTAETIVTEAFERMPDIDVITADGFEGGTLVPRPEWDPVLAASTDMPSPVAFVRKLAGSADADASSLRQTVETAAAAQRIAKVALPLAQSAADPRALIKAPQRPSLTSRPRVSVIIPTKYRIDLLEKCLQSLIDRTDYGPLDVVIVDNGSTDPDFDRVIETARDHLDLQVVRDHGDFNFPRLIKSGVDASTGDILLILNDDIEAHEAGWLDRMVASALEPGTGAVGARLLYPSGDIQHAGVALGLSGNCAHQWLGTSPEAASRNPLICLPGQRMAVTAACLLLRREVWTEAGGMDGSAFPVAFNDIDLCLRLHELGYKNIYRGDAVLTHHESQSRGSDAETARKRKRAAGETVKFYQRWRDVILAGDPFSSPAFDISEPTGAVHKAFRRP